MLSIDYDSQSEITKEFFATVQNKFHFAITGKTAAEIIHEKANKTEPPINGIMATRGQGYPDARGNIAAIAPIMSHLNLPR